MGQSETMPGDMAVKARPRLLEAYERDTQQGTKVTNRFHSISTAIAVGWGISMVPPAWACCMRCHACWWGPQRANQWRAGPAGLTLSDLCTLQLVYVSWSPAQFRDMQLDTHKTAGPCSAGTRPGRLTALTAVGGGTAPAASKTAPKSRNAPQLHAPGPRVEPFAADFEPSTERKHVWGLRRERAALQVSG